MKQLHRLLLINWHYFIHQVIELKNINFLTGKTGSGKSTIIDALQLLMLGDTTGSYFNKAANDQSRRSLKSYLWGEIAENEEEGTVYLRQGRNFSSYIVGEFFDTQEKKYFCFGIVFDNYADGSKEDHRFFYLGCELPKQSFLRNNTPLGIKDLREWAVQTVGRKEFTHYESNAAYREEFRHLMGGLGEKFFSLFRKAVPFSPIMDIKGFIGDFVCNVTNKVEITDMRENIRYYKQLEGELDLINRRIEALAEIEKQFQSYSEEDKRLDMQRFLVDRAIQEKSAVDLQSTVLRYQTRQNDLQEIDQERIRNENRQQDLEVKYQEAVAEKARCAEQQQKEYLEQRARYFEEKLSRYEQNQKKLQAYLLQYQQASDALIDIANNLEFYQGKVEKAPANDLSQEFWTAFQRDYQAALLTVREAYHSLKDQEKKVKERAAEINQQLLQLKKGIKSYERNLLDLMDAIRVGLSTSSHQVAPQVFADLLEIKDPKWRDAIEGYLHTQKFYFILHPADFVPALKIYDQLKFERKFYDLGLVDVEKMMKRVKPPLPGSLAEEVKTGNTYARAYADYLLGRVIKVERVDDLRLYSTAITPTCMLYQNYVARQINPQRYAMPYIGQKSIEKQILILEEKQDEVKQELVDLGERITIFSRLNQLPDFRDDDRERILQYFQEGSEIEAVKSDYEHVLEDLGKLDLTKVIDLDQKIAQLNDKKQKCNDQWKEITDNYNKLELSLKNLVTERIPALEQELHAHQAKVEQYLASWRQEQGEPRFQAELRRLGQAEKVGTNFSSQLARTESQRQIFWNGLLEKRSNFNRDFRGTLEVTAFHNAAWAEELQRLHNTSMPEYEEKIKAAREKAQREFQEDFISKLRQNIELVREQINDLNKALKDVPFGRNRYRFRVSANSGYKEYYTMIMDEMLLEGYTLFSNEFLARYQPVVDQLFNQIVTTAETELSPEQKEELEENLVKYTDYRTYLDFDLLDIDEEGRESRLSKTINKKSGGETQTPFYIAVLASFLQTYRVNQTNFNNTLRLLVFDEAYSKMDHQRIQESIKLLRDSGLQVVIAAPTEKIGDIAPFVDRNLCVTRVRQEAVVKAFDPKELIS